MIVRTLGQITMTELSSQLCVSPPSASAMVDRLVEKGILTREHSTEDRRKVMVRVSPEAMEDIKGVEETILSSFVDLVEKIGPETARKWCEVLERVESVL
jgi:DNA-binding MarR family transcriptional regulator